MVPKDLRDLAVARYGFDRGSLSHLSAGREATKQLYAFERCGKRYVLRFHERPAEQLDRVKAELAWMEYLADRGVGVVRPLATLDGSLVFAAEDHGATHLVTATEMAEGVPWDKNDPNRWNGRVFRAWGKAMGDIHRASKDYVPDDGAARCPEFTNIISGNVEMFPSVKRAADELIAEIMALPRDRGSYGLVHSDLNPSNFLISGDLVTVFDFDDCVYAWFAYDIGVALAVGLWIGQRNDAGHDFTSEMITHFLAGYLAANPLSDFWLAKIPLFMRLCQIAGFSITYDCRDPGDDRQNELIRNIENHIFQTGCEISDHLFMSTSR